MPSSYEEQRAALERWLEQQRPALDRADWSAAFKDYPRLNLADEPIPWTPFSGDTAGDVATARIGLVCSAGIYISGEQEPFDAANPYGDLSVRAIPLATPTAQLAVAHDHFDHTAARQDINAVYPVERLRELAREGAIGGLVDPAITFMGYNPDWAAARQTLVPAVVERVAALQPDAALLVPV